MFVWPIRSQILTRTYFAQVLHYWKMNSCTHPKVLFSTQKMQQKSISGTKRPQYLERQKFFYPGLSGLQDKRTQNVTV